MNQVTREYDAPQYAVAARAADVQPLSPADYEAHVNKCRREITAEDLLDELMDCGDVWLAAVKRGDDKLAGRIARNVLNELAESMADRWFEIKRSRLTTHQVAAMTCYGFEGQR